jgi:hypothetical protein
LFGNLIEHVVFKVSKFDQISMKIDIKVFLQTFGVQLTMFCLKTISNITPSVFFKHLFLSNTWCASYNETLWNFWHAIHDALPDALPDALAIYPALCVVK